MFMDQIPFWDTLLFIYYMVRIVMVSGYFLNKKRYEEPTISVVSQYSRSYPLVSTI